MRKINFYYGWKGGDSKYRKQREKCPYCSREGAKCSVKIPRQSTPSSLTAEPRSRRSASFFFCFLAPQSLLSLKLNVSAKSFPRRDSFLGIASVACMLAGTRVSILPLVLLDLGFDRLFPLPPPIVWSLTGGVSPTDDKLLVRIGLEVNTTPSINLNCPEDGSGTNWRCFLLE